MFFCPDSNFKFELNGTMSGEKANVLTFYVEPCNQKILDLHFPGEKKKCKPQSAILPYLKNLSITVAILTQYFN